ncbi:MAG: hypothetical protein JWP54_3010, partial [Cryobacterium sp.]|nr:hypothetical protein [Cryobacterium sp.]
MSDLTTTPALPPVPQPTTSMDRSGQPHRRLSVVRVFLGVVL